MRFTTILALVAATITGASAAHAQQTKQLSIATGGTGGVYYPLGGGFGNILGKELPGVTATAQVTGGSVANLQLIGSGKADLCFTPGRRGLGRRSTAPTSSPAASCRSGRWPSCIPTTCTW